MPDLVSRSIGLNIIGLRIFGLYPPDCCKFKNIYKIHTYTMYLVCIVSVPILGVLNLILSPNLSLKQIADNAFLIAELGCFIPKLWPFVKHAERLKKCIKFFQSPIFFVTKIEHKRIENKCVQMCKRATAIFFLCVCFGFASWSSRPISWAGHTFPTEVWLPFNPKEAPKIYVAVVYFYLVVAVGYGAFTSAMIDPLAGSLAYLASSQIKILKNNLTNLPNYVEEELLKRKKTKEDIFYEKIRQSVTHHIKILDFVKEYEACFSQVAFSQFVGGVVVVCVSCLQLTIVNPLSFDFLSMIMYLIAMLSEIYLYCHFGTELYEESITITDAIYMGNWYNYSIRSRKSLILLMERAKKPIVVTSGKILDLSLVTFTMILRRSYSLLAVLKNYDIGSRHT